MSLEIVRRRGSRNLYLRGTVRGQSIFETTGTNNAQAADAIRIAREARLLADSVYGKKATVTFAEAALSYMESGGSPRFLGEYINGKWTCLIGRFYNTKLHTIGQNDLDAAALALYPNTQPETRNRHCYTPFSAVWNHAVKNQWADFRKWSRPKRPKGTAVARLRPVRAGTTAVSYQRAAEFVLALSPAPAYVMTALFYTGMRPIELFALESQRVDIVGRWVTLMDSKTGEPRGIPLHEFLVPLLTPLVARGGRVFRSPRGAPYPVAESSSDHFSGQMKTAINSARGRSGITNISPYTARHTVSTQLVVNGVHSHLKDQILGHAVDDMSRHYTHIPQAELVEAINTLPVIEAWRKAYWFADPLKWQNKFAGHQGARNDLKREA